MTPAVGAVLGVTTWLAMAPPVSAHTIIGAWDSPLPLVAYVAAAALTVAASFALVIVKLPPEGRANRAPTSVTVPVGLVYALRFAGAAAWLWIVVQTVARWRSAEEVRALFERSDAASLVLWVYGWVGIAVVSALVGPVWRWIDPFATLYDLGARFAGALRPGVSLANPDDYPRAWGQWPAVAFFVIFAWLEIGVQDLVSPAFALLAYTVITLTGMSMYGRDTWRENAEVFTVWFRILGRLAPLREDPVDERRLIRRSFGSGLRERWSVSEVALVGIATFTVIFDAVSQTKPWFDALGLAGSVLATLTLPLWIPLIGLVVVRSARVVGARTLGAALTPVAAGYIVAHYLTYVLLEGQRLANAVSDPLGIGWDLIGTTFYRPTLEWLPAGIVWAVQLAVVVGGHVVGAVTGHRLAAAEGGEVRTRDVLLATIMVPLTAVTLWALGQAVIRDPGSFTA